MVSVIIPVYNGAKYIKEAVESVLAQNIDDLEVIIVDDGSTDNTCEVIESIVHPAIKYIYQNNAGASHARNTGLKIARHKFISFLDADDFWPKGKLQKQIDQFNSSPDLKVVGGLIDYFYMPGSEYQKRENIDGPVFNVQLGGLMVRREVIELVGFFNESHPCFEDQDWLLRIREKKLPIKITDDVVLHYRIHEGNLTIQRGIKDLNIIKALKLSLDRRRKEGISSLEPIDEL
jgi:glycosyltransferase involved in cell wall biosynthesis